MVVMDDWKQAWTRWSVYRATFDNLRRSLEDGCDVPPGPGREELMERIDRIIELVEAGIFERAGGELH
jgi:hypothetical protein